MLKRCPSCGKILLSSSFSKGQKYCKICARDYQWQYKYGISPEQYFEMYKKQNGKCLICGCEPKDGEYLSVDHDNQTGEVRGLLCSKCNTGIGLLGESLMTLGRAIKYLATGGRIKE